MELPGEHLETHPTIRLIQDEGVLNDDQSLTPLPDVVAQPILEREARQEERAKREVEHVSHIRRTRGFARLVTRLSKDTDQNR